ncbi:minor tail protein [Mycobacterium phage Hawkeye]|uniref:Minor tail protein n=1 Tax=Mycobacterium phage Hawkeye TaxID=1458711 RepID=X2KRG6_9CAUD|nr:minor tail protein [Mycobacterium phage Hawkeye]AHN84043.1 minor tail protein [Mycobacterium phage Hawkeye]
MAYEYESKEARALRSIQSKNYPDTNKDFVKNMQRLNSSVDYISSYMIVMQKGIDDANKNFIEQIQSFINDLIVLFAGGEPTGIEFGDLKYIIQGLGALFGLNGPFPLSLIEAAEHFFLGYVVPLPQFTDVITDTILAWAEELGLDPEFIAALREFTDAITELGVDIYDLLSTILEVFNIFDITDLGTGPLAAFWGLLTTLFDGLNTVALKPILSAISTWTIPFIEALTQLVNYIDDLVDGLANNKFLKVDSPLDVLNLFGTLPAKLFGNVPVGSITGETENRLPDGSFAPGSIALDPKWIVDETKSRSDDGTGAAKVVADGTPQALRSGKTGTDTIAVNPGQTYTARAFVAYENYVGTGESIKLQLVTFKSGVRDKVVPIASFAPAVGDFPWPGKELSGTYTVEAGVTGVQTRLYVSEEALEGSIWFDDVSTGSSGRLRPEWIDGLPESLQDAFLRWQLLIDTLFNALTKAGTFLNTLADLDEAFNNFPFANIGSILGSINLGGDILATLNALVGGAVGQQGTDATPDEAFNIFQMLSNWANRGDKAKEVTDTRTNTPASGGLAPSEKSNFSMGEASSWFAITPTTALTSYDYVEKDMPLGAISWVGYGNSGVTGLYINVWKVNVTTGLRTPLHSSGNVVGLLAGIATAAPGTYIQYELPTPAEIHISELLGYEIITVGGTHNVRGRVYNFPAHPTAPIAKTASVRDASASPATPPASITKASTTWSDNAAWVGIAVDTGSGGDHRDPMWVYLGSKPTTTPRPKWAKRIIAVACGPAGGGHLGGSWGFAGNGGSPGKFATAIWDEGVDYTEDLDIITFDPGVGGDPGSSPLDQNGGDGTVATISIPGRTLTAEGGEGSKSIRFVATQGKPVGKGPGTFEFEGFQFPAGTDQRAYGGDGVAPGGAGNGGDWAFVSAGGRGAPGGGWVVFLPGDSGGGEPPENTPPTAPTVTVESATFSSITISASGATD